jgi:hypothetical protein
VRGFFRRHKKWILGPLVILAVLLLLLGLLSLLGSPPPFRYPIF